MTSLHYQVHGSGVKKLVILHGLFGSGDNWRSIAQKYLQSEFEVYLVDQRNHGRSFHHEVQSYCLLYTSPSPRDRQKSRMPSSA